MKADIVDLTYNIDREEFKELIKNTLLIKELIDDGFNITNLGSVLDSTKYGYTASALDEGNVKMIRITDLKNNSINLDTVPFCNCKNYEDYLVKKGDILIGRTGTVGKSFLLDYELELDSVYASYLIRLRINKEIVLPEYVYLYLNSYYFWNQLHEIKSGGVKMNINANKIKGLQIPICSIEEQRVILDKKNNGTSGFESALKTVSNIHLLEDTISSNKNYIKLLKQSILQEAIEGKLTKSWREKNKDIEPASVLLEKIKAEKDELIKQKKLKKQKELKPIEKDEIPFNIPESWEWCRLGEICNIKSSKRIYESDYRKNGVTFYRSKEIGQLSKGVEPENKYFISEEKFSSLEEFGYPKKGDIFITAIGGSIGNVWVSDGRVFYYKDGNVIQLDKYNNINTILLEKYLNGDFFLDQVVERTQTGIYGALTIIKAKNSLFPLPPLQEQKEIVKKVDELMRFCDELEKQTLEAKESSENLMKAVLGEVFNR